jgi:hypothetical protein
MYVAINENSCKYAGEDSNRRRNNHPKKQTIISLFMSIEVQDSYNNVTHIHNSIVVDVDVGIPIG